MEFQVIRLNGRVLFDDPVSSLAYLGLARAYALQGDTGKAGAAYSDFLGRWKDTGGALQHSLERTAH